MGCDRVTYRDVSGFPGYRVGDDGSIWSRHRRNGAGLGEQWRQLTPRRGANGYLKVNLRMSGLDHARYVHRLVLEAFVGEAPDGAQACHGDGDRTNNALDNLRWDTRASNEADKYLHGTARGTLGQGNGAAKLSEADVREIRDLCRGGALQWEVAILFGVSRSLVSMIMSGQLWSHV